MEGKHDISDTLDRHYKNRIRRLEAQLELSTEKLQEAMTEIEKRDFRIRALEAKVEEFSKALAEMTVKAVMGGVK